MQTLCYLLSGLNSKSSARWHLVLCSREFQKGSWNSWGQWWTSVPILTISSRHGKWRIQKKRASFEIDTFRSISMVFSMRKLKAIDNHCLRGIIIPDLKFGLRRADFTEHRYVLKKKKKKKRVDCRVLFWYTFDSVWCEGQSFSPNFPIHEARILCNISRDGS